MSIQVVPSCTEAVGRGAVEGEAHTVAERLSVSSVVSREAL